MVQLILTALGLGGKLWQRRQELKAAEMTAETKIRIQRMADAKDWETVVAQKSSRFLRWMLAAHLLAGLDVTIYMAINGSPNPGILFDAMALLPDWYAGLLTTMFAWAFASQPLKDAGGALVARWRARGTLATPKHGKAPQQAVKAPETYTDTNS